MHGIQSDNGPGFNVKVTQGISQALGIKFHLHCAWRPQSSGKVGKANDIIKRQLQKVFQDTHLSWTSLLPLALVRIRNTPESQGLSPVEMLYGRPFLKNDLLLDQEMAELTKHVPNLASFQKQLQSLVNGIWQQKRIKSPYMILGTWFLTIVPP